LDQSVIELVQAAEQEARQMKADAESERLELVRQGEIVAQQFLDDHQLELRKKKQEILAQQSRLAQEQADNIVAAGRDAAKGLEATARRNMSKAVDAILRKVL